MSYQQMPFEIHQVHDELGNSVVRVGVLEDQHPIRVALGHDKIGASLTLKQAAQLTIILSRAVQEASALRATALRQTARLEDLEDLKEARESHNERHGDGDWEEAYPDDAERLRSMQEV